MLSINTYMSRTEIQYTVLFNTIIILNNCIKIYFTLNNPNPGVGLLQCPWFSTKKAILLLSTLTTLLGCLYDKNILLLSTLIRMSGFLFTKYILLLSTLILVAWCLFTKNILLLLTRGVGLRYYSARNSADRVGILRFLKA